jgi:hypothetical protein
VAYELSSSCDETTPQPELRFQIMKDERTASSVEEVSTDCVRK